MVSPRFITVLIAALLLAGAAASARELGRAAVGGRQIAIFEDRTWRFVDERQTDREHGEWYETVTPDGEGLGDKAHRWKAGYHNGRALLECLRLLKTLQ